MNQKTNKLQSITTIIQISFLAFTILPILLITFIGLKTSEDILIENEKNHLERDGALDAVILQSRISLYTNQLEILANTETIEDYKENYPNEIPNLLLDELNEELEEYTYGVTQLRLLGVDGMELVRINSKEGESTFVEKEFLQNKADRYYFTETMKMSADQIYFSDIDLNKEGSPPIISLPYEPTIRIAIPISNNAGINIGILIANINANRIFDGLYNNESGKFEVVTDPQGFYLIHRDESKLYGGSNNLGSNENLFNDYPELKNAFLNNQTLPTINFDDKLYITTKIYPSTETFNNYWLHIIILDEATLLEPTAILSTNSFKFTLFALIIIIIFSIVITKLFGKPIKQLVEDVQIISSGNLDHQIIIPKQYELANFAKSFNKMAVSLKEYRDYLDKKVSSRTTKLETLTESMVGRELKMIRLKKELNELKKQKND